MEIIRKHNDEHRRKKSEIKLPSGLSSSQRESDSSSPSQSGHSSCNDKKHKETKLDGQIDVKITNQNSHFSKFKYIHLSSCITSIHIPLFTLVTQL